MEDTDVVQFRSDDKVSKTGMIKRKDIEFVWQLQLDKGGIVGSNGKTMVFEQGENHYLEIQIEQGGDVRTCFRINDLTV
jgi:hypothetical protein